MKTCQTCGLKLEDGDAHRFDRECITALMRKNATLELDIKRKQSLILTCNRALSDTGD